MISGVGGSGSLSKNFAIAPNNALHLAGRRPLLAESGHTDNQSITARSVVERLLLIGDIGFHPSDEVGAQLIFKRKPSFGNTR